MHYIVEINLYPFHCSKTYPTLNPIDNLSPIWDRVVIQHLVPAGFYNPTRVNPDRKKQSNRTEKNHVGIIGWLTILAINPMVGTHYLEFVLNVFAAVKRVEKNPRCCNDAIFLQPQGAINQRSQPRAHNRWETKQHHKLDASPNSYILTYVRQKTNNEPSRKKFDQLRTQSFCVLLRS